MAVLIDTNVLLRAVQPSHPMHPVALRALERLFTGPEPLFIAIQNVAEFWNAATRPLAVNGLGMTVEEAGEEVKRLESFFEIVSESAASCAAWKTLVTAHRVSGAQVHDARLAAVMIATGITRIVTFNVRDFNGSPQSRPFTRNGSQSDRSGNLTEPRYLEPLISLAVVGHFPFKNFAISWRASGFSSKAM